MLLQRREMLALGGTALISAALPRTSRAASRPPAAREGFADVPGGRVWWRALGSGSRTPLLLLHGGPGAGHDYLEPLGALATDRPVIFYDQLGCGRSDKPDDPSLWRIERFVEEIDAVRQALKLDRVMLYGHSYGGWLAQEYMRRSDGAGSVEKLVLASTSASVAEFVDGAQRLLATLPNGMGARCKQLEAAGATDTPEYAKIVETFYDRYLVHVDNPPDYLKRTFANLGSSRNYSVMNGPNEFTVIGTLKDWDARSALADIRVPTLVLTSEWDQVTLDCHERIHHAIRGSTLTVMPRARHLAMVEQPQRYNAILRRFLETDKRAREAT